MPGLFPEKQKSFLRLASCIARLNVSDTARLLKCSDGFSFFQALIKPIALIFYEAVAVIRNLHRVTLATSSIRLTLDRLEKRFSEAQPPICVASLKNPHPGQRNDIDSKTDLIQTLPKERTAFVIAHRFQMDIIYVLEGGRILEAIRFYSKKKTASTGTCTMP